LTGRRKLTIWLMALLAGLAGCGGGAPLEQPQLLPPPPPATYGHADQALLEESLQGRSLSGVEVADLSDRLLTEGCPTFQDPKTMARLELLLYKGLKADDRQSRPRVLRNLGIIHYHQKEYKRARQELQASNELNPKDARTHFYLARLFAHQGNIYQARGKKRISRQQIKRAAIEIEQARKLEPSNPLYRQDLQEVLQQERNSR
jgi:tetratricopeptide (TPR) repeat protein